MAKQEHRKPVSVRAQPVQTPPPAEPLKERVSILYSAVVALMAILAAAGGITALVGDHTGVSTDVSLFGQRLTTSSEGLVVFFVATVVAWAMLRWRPPGIGIFASPEGGSDENPPPVPHVLRNIAAALVVIGFIAAGSHLLVFH